ncbi:U-box domain-containing protein 4 [Phtheirospermum japonicum]|uniref:U-box domain-containing protein 4 n=1 Tax=Phtheirospermum japonicum TaxID=374723 RepID=A0A830DDM4_9LAMI|nr:U-box domain-containing protein 4 [Phtheirospermum japonicum]
MEISLTALLVLSTCSANKLRIASSGAIQLILQFLDSRFTTVCISTRAKLDIISTLHNLSTCPQMISTILACGGLNTLNQLIYESEKSSDLVEKATGFLETIVFRSKVALNQVGESGVVIPMLVEAVEDGSAACREYAVGILLLICQSCRERYRGMILNEGAMAGMMQLSVNGTRIAREKAKELISLLRDRDSGRSSSSMSMDMRTKSEALEELMRQIDEEESGGIQMVEEMIAKLRT